jgi:hypothetical protein
MIAALLLAAATASPSPRPTPRPRPVFLVTITPALPFAGEGVKGKAIIRDPGHELHCPEFTWEWGDGCTSHQASDCPDVYAQPEDEPSVYVVELSYLHPYRKPGDYTVRLTLKSGGRSYIGQAAVVVH